MRSVIKPQGRVVPDVNAASGNVGTLKEALEPVRLFRRTYEAVRLQFDLGIEKRDVIFRGGMVRYLARHESFHGPRSQRGSRTPPA